MVSWGTTANVSMPVGPAPVRRPPGWWRPGRRRRVAARGRASRPPARSCPGSPTCAAGRRAELADLAAASPPGARGVTAVPWLTGPGPRGGGRGPGPASWACPPGTDPGTWPAPCSSRWPGTCSAAWPGWTARAPGEARPWPHSGSPGAPPHPVWMEVLTGITGLPVRLRRSGQAASAGAALLGAVAVGTRGTSTPSTRWSGDVPRTRRSSGCYAERVPYADRVAGTLIDLELAAGRMTRPRAHRRCTGRPVGHVGPARETRSGAGYRG